MRKNIHKKSEARPIKNTPHKTTRNKKNHHPTKNQIKNSLHCDADEFYLMYIYMFICATANKNNTDDSDNTHHSKFLSHATTHTFSQIIIFDTSDTQKPQNKSACIHEHSSTSYSRYITYSFYEPQQPRESSYIMYILGTPALRIPVILCIVLGASAHKTIHNIHYAPLARFTNRCPLGRKTGRNFVLTHNKTATKKIQHKNEYQYKHHCGANNNKSHNQYRRKIIAQTSVATSTNFL